MPHTEHTLLVRWPGYAVTRDGVVFSVRSNWRGYGAREMHQQPDQDGYLRVRLTVGLRKRRAVAVHHLVADAFLPPRPSLSHEIRHLDGDKRNNAAPNLRWGTPKENATDREQHGRTSRGSRHSEFIKAGFAKHRSISP